MAYGGWLLDRLPLVLRQPAVILSGWLEMAVIDVTGLRVVTDDVTGDVDHVYVVLSDDEGTSTVKVEGDLTQFLKAFSISKDSVRIGNARVSTGYSPFGLTPSSINL